MKYFSLFKYDFIKYVISFLGILFVASNLFAQAPDTLWTRTYGGSGDDIGRHVQQTLDGGFIIAGQTESFGAGLDDVWLIRTNAFGDTLWTRTYGGPDVDVGLSVQVTSDSGFIVIGSTRSFGAGLNDAWLIRTDPSGDTLWTRTYGGTFEDGGASVQQTSDGGFIITGQTESFGAGLDDVWLIRTNAFGDTLWTRTYGGSGDDIGRHVQQTSDGGFIIAGQTESFGAGSLDVWLIRTDEFGDTLWTRTYGGLDVEKGKSVQQTFDGGFIVTGYNHSFSAGSCDLWLVRTDISGDTLWTRIYGGPDVDAGLSVQVTSDSGFIVAGHTQTFGAAGLSDLWLVRTDNSGDTLWTRTYGGVANDNEFSIQETALGGFIVAGATSSFGAGGSDVWLLRIGGSVTGVDYESALLKDFVLRQNYPNPFNPSTSIEYTLSQSVEVSLIVFNLRGQEIAYLVNEFQQTGNHSVTWNATDFSSGIYIYRLQAGDFVITRKMVLLK